MRELYASDDVAGCINTCNICSAGIIDCYYSSVIFESETAVKQAFDICPSADTYQYAVSSDSIFNSIDFEGDFISRQHLFFFRQNIIEMFNRLNNCSGIYIGTSLCHYHLKVLGEFSVHLRQYPVHRFKHDNLCSEVVINSCKFHSNNAAAYYYQCFKRLIPALEDHVYRMSFCRPFRYR